MRVALFGIGIISLAILGSMGTIAHAGVLSYQTDLISTSVPEASSTHTIQFTVTNAIPPSGQLVISLTKNAFAVPPAFNYTDVDLLVSRSGGPFVDRELAQVADALRDGVAVTSDGTITFTLNSTNGLLSGDVVRVLLGTNATHGAVGTDNIVNPFFPNSYRILFQTLNLSSTEIDHGATMIAIVQPVTLRAAIPVVAPVRSNGLPTGLIAANNTTIELSLQTDLFAHCRYATSSGVLYTNMANDFNPTFGTTHWVNTTSYQNGTMYTFYVRCVAFASNFANSDDYPITFTIKPTPISNTSIQTAGNVTSGPTGNLGRGGAGDFPNGSDVLYLSSVTFSGTSIPNSVITLLRDGVKAGTVQAKPDGSFSSTIDKLERGAYGFQLSAQDVRGLTSSLYSTTLSVGQGTDNSITNILLPPTIQLSTDSASPGDKVTVSGYAPGNSIVQVKVFPQASTSVASLTKTYTASSSASGDWSVSFDTAQMTKGAYNVQATAALSGAIKSGISKSLTFSLGTGGAASSCGKPDMNGDGKVNLVDFSIFLLSWNTSAPQADYNCDGTVNLADFSIMLFQWTG